MRTERAAQVHFWITAFSAVVINGLFFLAISRAGFFSPSIERPQETPVFRPADPDPGPVVVIVNNPPDESACLEIVTDFSSRPVVDQVVSVRKLRDLPETEDLTFEQQVKIWRENEQDRLNRIQRGLPAPPYEPSPEEIIRNQRIEKQNEIEIRISQQIAEAEFDTIEQRERDRTERHRRTVQREKELQELRKQYSRLEKHR